MQRSLGRGATSLNLLAPVHPHLRPLFAVQAKYVIERAIADERREDEVEAVDTQNERQPEFDPAEERRSQHESTENPTNTPAHIPLVPGRT